MPIALGPPRHSTLGLGIVTGSIVHADMLIKDQTEDQRKVSGSQDGRENKAFQRPKIALAYIITCFDITATSW